MTGMETSGMMYISFFMMAGIVSVFIPSAPRWIWRKRVAAVTQGRIMVGSATARFWNQARPPVVSDSTGALHMPRMPKKADVKNTPCAMIGHMVLAGWQFSANMYSFRALLANLASSGDPRSEAI